MTKDTRDTLDVALGFRLKQIRKSKGWTQEHLGQAVEVSFQQIQKYEKGTNRVSVAMLIRLCKVLDSDPAPIAAELRRLA